MAADPQTASAAALVVSNFAVGQVHLGKLLFALANRVQGALQHNCAMLAAVAGNFAVVHGEQLFFHTESAAPIIVGGFAGVIGQGAVAPGSACLYAVTGIVIPIVLVQVRNVHRRIQTVGIVLDGHVVKRAVGRHIIRIVLVVAAAQHADDTALALGVGKAGVGNFQIVAVMDKQYGIISAIAADGIVVKHSVGNLGTVAEIIGIRDINSISRGHVVDDAAVVDKDLTLCLTAAGVANINSRSRTAISCNVAIKQHVAHMLGAAAAYLQGCAAAVIVAVASGVADKLGVVAILGQLNIRVIADGEQVAAHIHAAGTAVGFVILKQVARAKGQAALVVVHSAAASRSGAVVGKGALVQQSSYRNGRGVHVHGAALAVGSIILKGIVLQHGIVATVVVTAFSFFVVGAGNEVACTTIAIGRVACKAVALQRDGMGSQIESTTAVGSLVFGKLAIRDGYSASSIVHIDCTAVAVCQAVVGKLAVICYQCARAREANGRTAPLRRSTAVVAEGDVLCHQLAPRGENNCITTKAVQDDILQLNGNMVFGIGIVGLVAYSQTTPLAGKHIAAIFDVGIRLGRITAQGKGQPILVQITYSNFAGEGVAVQVQGGAVLGVVDGHILGLVAQQVDCGGVSFCILGIRCFHSLDGLIDAEILITANTGGVTAGVLPLRGQGVDGLGFGGLLHGLDAGLIVVFQPDEIFGILDALSVQGLGIGQVDRTTLGKQHIARDGSAVEQGLFAHGQGAVGSAQIQVAGQLAGGVIPDDAAHVRALGGREGDLALVGDINCTAVIGRIVIDFAADHG